MAVATTPALPHHDDGALICVLPSSLQAPGVARHWASASARSQQVCGNAVDTLELVVTELVTNAVIHGSCDVVQCRLRRSGNLLRLEVTEKFSTATARRQTAARAPEGLSESGRGLVLVAHVAEAWGLLLAAVEEEYERGSTAWAEILADAA